MSSSKKEEEEKQTNILKCIFNDCDKTIKHPKMKIKKECNCSQMIKSKSSHCYCAFRLDYQCNCRSKTGKYEHFTWIKEVKCEKCNRLIQSNTAFRDFDRSGKKYYWDLSCEHCGYDNYKISGKKMSGSFKCPYCKHKYFPDYETSDYGSDYRILKCTYCDKSVPDYEPFIEEIRKSYSELEHNEHNDIDYSNICRFYCCSGRRRCDHCNEIYCARSVYGVYGRYSSLCSDCFIHCGEDC